MTTHRDIELEEIKKFVELNNPQNVLEIGCSSNPFHDHFNAEKYTCIDIKGQQNKTIIECDVHDLNDESIYDCVFISHTAEHFLNPVKAWKNIFNSLIEGGKVLSITPNPCQHQILQGDKDHIFVLTPQQWIRLLMFVGFKNIRSYKQMTFHNQQIQKEQNYNIITIAEK